jgi:hypothetical protein
MRALPECTIHHASSGSQVCAAFAAHTAFGYGWRFGGMEKKMKGRAKMIRSLRACDERSWDFVDRCSGCGGTGTLVSGGGAFPPEAEVARRFLELAGGEKARIVIIPTALEDEQINGRGEYSLEKYMEPFGATRYTVPHTRDRLTANRNDFVAPLKKATGVWIVGGSAAALVPIYLDTRTQSELEAVLGRTSKTSSCRL